MDSSEVGTHRLRMFREFAYRELEAYFAAQHEEPAIQPT